MTWIERLDKRTQRGKLWQDVADPTKFSVDATLAAIHYEEIIDSGIFNTPVDVTPVRIDDPNFDGWRVTESGWHYALGKDLANHGDQDGWVGFGGRKGQHWFKFRLARVGYLHWPTRAWDDIGGAPDYDRANLSQQTEEIEFATDGSMQPIGNVAVWDNIWQTPTGGNLSVSWRVGGDRLKEEITINQSGREWIATNRPPATPLSETYFGFVFQLDWSDIPEVYRQGLLQDIEEDFADDDQPIELKDALGRALAFIPVSKVLVPNEEPDLEVYQPLRKRFYKDTDGKYYLLLGVRADVLNSMPAGDLIFDPTIDDQVALDVDDAYTQWGTLYPSYDYLKVNEAGVTTMFSGWVFRDVALPGDAIVATAYITLRQYSSLDDVSWDIHGEENRTPQDIETGTLIDSRTRTTEKTPWVQGNMTAGAWYNSPSIVDVVQELIEDTSGWSSGDDLCIIGKTVHNGLRGAFYDYQSGSGASAGKLHIVYNLPPKDNKSAYLEGIGERLHPDGDISQSDNWKRDTGSSVDLYLSIDEFPRDDADYVWYDNAAVGKYFEVSLENPTWSSIGAGDVKIVWCTKRRAGTQTMTLKVELREGVTVRASQIEELTDTDAVHIYTLSGGEKSSISDWDDLRLRFTVESLT